MAKVAPLGASVENMEDKPAMGEDSVEAKREIDIKAESEPLVTSAGVNEDTEEEDTAKQECRNLCFYLSFLFFFFVYSWLGRGDEGAYYLTEKVKDEVLYNEYRTGSDTPVSFYGINNFDDMWNFIEGDDSPIIGTLFAETGTDGKTFPMYEKYGQYWPNHGNVLFGGVRIR